MIGRVIVVTGVALVALRAAESCSDSNVMQGVFGLLALMGGVTAIVLAIRLLGGSRSSWE